MNDIKTILGMLNSASLNILAVLAISLSVLANWDLQPVNAQNSTAVDFLTYQNPTLGFTLQYPSDWQVEENTDETGIRFMAPDRSIPIFHVRIKEVAPYLDTNTMTVKNKTLEEVVQELQNNISQPNALGLDSKLIRQNQVTVGGNAGWKIEMFIGPQTEPYYYLFEVLTIANGKQYSLEYNERPLNVPGTLPLVNKMVESFRIIT